MSSEELTGEETIFLFPSICSREGSSGSFLSGQTQIAFALTKGVQGL